MNGNFDLALTSLIQNLKYIEEGFPLSITDVLLQFDELRGDDWYTKTRRSELHEYKQEVKRLQALIDRDKDNNFGR